ncbi:MAG: FKBP-type peptidyl-prolyl cis-trans isomerase [Alphaproteobacteria bacterium]
MSIRVFTRRAFLALLFVISGGLGVSEEAAGGDLGIVDMRRGEGREATRGDTVEVHYTGWLTNGTKFDSSLDRNEPFRFRLGRGQVIQGWDEGVAGMREGGVRKLTIPPEMGYGRRGAGPIPPDSTLEFEVRLLKVTPAR